MYELLFCKEAAEQSFSTERDMLAPAQIMAEATSPKGSCCANLLMS